MNIFGWQHILYLVICAIIFVPALICAKKFAKTERSQHIIVKATGVLLLISILISRIAQTLIYDTFNWRNFFPTAFCGTTSLVLSLAVVFGKKDNCVLHFTWFLALVGGIVTSIYPDFVGRNDYFFHPDVITSFVHHTISIVMVIVLLMFKHINITYKKWYYSLLGFCCYITYGVFLMATFGYSDTFNMFTPILDGTPLTVWVMAPICAVIYGLVLMTIEIVRKKKASHNKS